MKKLIILATAIAFLVLDAKANTTDSIKLNQPTIGIDDGFILEYFLKTNTSGKVRLFVSPIDSVSGFNPIKDWSKNKDTVGKTFTETITSGLPKSPVKIWLKLQWIPDSGSILETKIGYVKIEPKAIKPQIYFANSPYNLNGKIIANLIYVSNRDGQIDAFTVFNSTDTNSAISRKNWKISGSTGNQTLVDNSYGASTTDVWVSYSIKNTAGEEKTNWYFVPAYIAPQKPGIWIDTIKQISDKDLYLSGIVNIGGLNTDIWLTYSGIKTSIIKKTESGQWKHTIKDLPQGNQEIKAFALNSEGLDSTIVYQFKMVASIKPSYLGEIDFIINGLDVNIKTNYEIPSGKSGTISIEYDTDSSFSIPKDWITLTDISGQGLASGNFTLNNKGLFYARIIYFGNDTIVTRKQAFTVWTLGVDDLKKSTISIYPNPCQNVLNVPSAINTDPIVIYDTSGKVVITDTGSSIDVSFLTLGVYSIQTKTGITRFIKN